MNIDISNAHCGPRIQFPDHAWLRVVFIPKDCLRFFRERTSERWTLAWSRETTLRPRSVRLPWASSEMNREVGRGCRRRCPETRAHRRASRGAARRRARGDRAREPTACLAGSKGTKHASLVSLASRERERRGRNRHASSCTRRRISVLALTKEKTRSRTVAERSTAPLCV